MRTRVAPCSPLGRSNQDYEDKSPVDQPLLTLPCRVTQDGVYVRTAAESMHLSKLGDLPLLKVVKVIRNEIPGNEDQHQENLVAESCLACAHRAHRPATPLAMALNMSSGERPPLAQ